MSEQLETKNSSSEYSGANFFFILKINNRTHIPEMVIKLYNFNILRQNVLEIDLRNEPNYLTV